MTKALSLETLQTVVLERSLELPWTVAGCGQHFPLGGSSQTQQTPTFTILGGPLPAAGDGAWADSTPQGSALCPLRTQKGINREYFPGSEGNFSQIGTCYTLQVCVCAV